jgi:hypothetical protein
MRETSAAMVDWLGDNVVSLVGAGIAVVAVAMAWRSARAAERSATLASAQLHPLLVDVPYERYTDFEHEVALPTGETQKSAIRGEILANFSEGWLTMPVRNVGRGPAIVEAVELHLIRAGMKIPVAVAEAMTTPIVAPEEEARIGVMVVDEGRDAFAEAGHRQGGISLTVSYADYLHESRERATFDLGTRSRETAWRVLGVTNAKSERS